MMLGRCPVCHSHIALEAVVQDESARELLGLLAGMSVELGRALVAYLGLFRSAKRDLANDRALRLAREVRALTTDEARLATALAETVEALRGKGGPPLKNHNYLKRVLESVAVMPLAGTVPTALTTPTAHTPAQRLTSKTAQAMKALVDDLG